MSDTIAVVKQYYAIEEAYRAGYGEFEGLDVPENEPADVSAITDSARWANVVAPGLRASAGYADGGHGTYQKNRQVAAIKPGNEEDEPAEAELTDAETIYSALVDAWMRGARDAAHGDPADVESLPGSADVY